MSNDAKEEKQDLNHHESDDVDDSNVHVAENDDGDLVIEDETSNTMFSRIKKLPKKTTICSILLLAVGLMLGVGGVTCIAVCDDRLYSLIWFFAGLLLFIPGSYAFYALYKAVKKRRKKSMEKVLEQEGIASD